MLLQVPMYLLRLGSYVLGDERFFLFVCLSFFIVTPKAMLRF